jgi:hypothetical protein
MDSLFRLGSPLSLQRTPFSGLSAGESCGESMNDMSLGLVRKEHSYQGPQVATIGIMSIKPSP